VRLPEFHAAGSEENGRICTAVPIGFLFGRGRNGRDHDLRHGNHEFFHQAGRSRKPRLLGRVLRLGLRVGTGGWRWAAKRSARTRKHDGRTAVRKPFVGPPGEGRPDKNPIFESYRI
jgi:hypothetical protein